LLVSEIADNELRRKLLHIGSRRSLSRLDELGRELEYAPVTTADWRAAARLWAIARSTGRGSSAPERLEADALIAAQALSHGAVVVTPNARHFAGIVEARHWREISAD
jgi:predicted nucleic acid-binding protein